VTERSKATKDVDVSGLVSSSAYDLTKAESPEELASRLRRVEAEAEHTLRSQAEGDAHNRRLALYVHIFVMAVVAVAFLVSASIAAFMDPKLGLQHEAMG
jgi:hypothetical protein